MKKYALIGGSGFVGTNLSLKLLELGHEIHCLDNQSFTQTPNIQALKIHPNFYFHDGDVRDLDILDAFLSKPYDGVFHLASIVGIKNYLNDPLSLIDVNILGTRHVAQLCVKYGQRMLFTSTSEVLGRNTDVPWQEDADRVYGAPSVDRWAYGSSKGLAEHMINAMIGQSLKATIIRFFNIYGPYQRPYFVVSKTMYHAMRGEAPLMYDGGQQTRCFTYIDDATDALIALISSDKSIGETYHIGSSYEHSVQDVIAKTLEVTGSQAAPDGFDTQEAYGSVYEDIDRRVPAIDKIKDHIGWEASTDLQSGLSLLKDWVNENPWWLDLDASVTVNAK